MPLTGSQQLSIVLVAVGTLLYSAAFVVARWFVTSRTSYVREARISLSSRMGQMDVPQGVSASGVVGSILTLILTSGTPQKTTGSKFPASSYGALGAFFGALILLAPFFYIEMSARVAVWSTKGGVGTEHHGTVRSYLIATFLTMWGVLGAFVTISVVFVEFYEASILPLLIVALFIPVFVAALLVYTRYGWHQLDEAFQDRFGSTEQESGV
jgi:hypothetical protein